MDQCNLAMLLRQIIFCALLVAAARASVQFTANPGNTTRFEGQEVLCDCRYEGTVELAFWRINGTSYSPASLPAGYSTNESGLVFQAFESLNLTSYQCYLIMYGVEGIFTVDSDIGFVKVLPAVNSTSQPPMVNCKPQITAIFIQRDGDQITVWWKPLLATEEDACDCNFNTVISTCQGNTECTTPVANSTHVTFSSESLCSVQQPPPLLIAVNSAEATYIYVQNPFNTTIFTKSVGSDLKLNLPLNSTTPHLVCIFGGNLYDNTCITADNLPSDIRIGVNLCINNINASLNGTIYTVFGTTRRKQVIVNEVILNFQLVVTEPTPSPTDNPISDVPNDDSDNNLTIGLSVGVIAFAVVIICLLREQLGIIVCGLPITYLCWKYPIKEDDKINVR